MIAHWHRFAVPRSIADRDLAIHGNRNIATRAKDVLDAYLALTVVLESLSDEVGMEHTQEEIGILGSEDIAYHGWWSVNVMRPLYAVAPLTATREQFLERAVSLFKLLELLKPAPLRNIALGLGVAKDQLKGLGSLKLLACISQLAVIAKEHGYSLPDEAEVVTCNGTMRIN